MTQNTAEIVSCQFTVVALTENIKLSTQPLVGSKPKFWTNKRVHAGMTESGRESNILPNGDSVSCDRNFAVRPPAQNLHYVSG